MRTLKQLVGAASVLSIFAVVIGAMFWVQPAQAAPTPATATVAEMGLITQTQVTGDNLESLGVDGEAIDYAILVPNPLPPRTDAPIWVTFGQSFTYTFTITNLGAGIATNVVFVDTLPERVTLMDITASQGSCSGTSNLQCELGNLNPGQTAKINIEVLPNTLGLIANTGRVGSNVVDPDNGNNYRVKLHIVAPPEELENEAKLASAELISPPAVVSDTAATAAIETISGPVSISANEPGAEIYLPVIVKEHSAE